MSPHQFPTEVSAELKALSQQATRCLEGWLRNKIQILAGSNDLEAADDRMNHVIRGYARQRNRAAEIALEEFNEIFGRRD